MTDIAQLTADRQRFYDNWKEVEAELEATKAEVERLGKELFEAEQLAESRFAWASQVADRTAEQIAEWVDDPRKPPWNRSSLAKDIRAGAWKDGAK